MTQTETVTNILNNLERAPSSGKYVLATSLDTLRPLLTALRGSLEEIWTAANQSSVNLLPVDARAAMPDYQAVMSAAATRVEAIEVVSQAIADLEKAQIAATATVERVFKKMNAPRLEKRVWSKLRVKELLARVVSPTLLAPPVPSALPTSTTPITPTAEAVGPIPAPDASTATMTT